MGMYEDDVRTVPRGGPMYGYGYRPRPMWPVETKPFFLTSEFWGAELVIAGIAITAAASDSFGAWRAWILITAIVVGYLVSRGIAKSGTKSRSWDPREDPQLAPRRRKPAESRRRRWFGRIGSLRRVDASGKESMGQPAVHFEIIGQDARKLQQYYSELFGWEINAENPMQYGIVSREGNVNADGAGIGGGVARRA